MAQGKSEKQGGRRAINKLRCHPEVLHLVDPLADAVHQTASMKRPTANVSGDNPGDSAPVAGDERNQTLIHLGVAPLTYFPRTGSSNTVTWATHLFWQLPTSFTLPGGRGTLYPPAIPFRCSVKCAIHTYLRICRYCRYIKASGEVCQRQGYADFSCASR